MVHSETIYAQRAAAEALRHAVEDVLLRTPDARGAVRGMRAAPSH